MYWKIFTIAGKTILHMEHTKVNLQHWTDAIQSLQSQDIRTFTFVYNEGRFVGKLELIPPRK